MMNKKGFTLTEVLLGIMIVGIIGIALAALTTSATRDSGISSSRIMLRNNLSIVLRQLRADIHESSNATNVAGVLNSNTNTNLITLVKNKSVSGNIIRNVSDKTEGFSVYYVTYCYVAGTDGNGVLPSGAYRGGQIKRLENLETEGNCQANGKVILNNVKYIPGSYPTPLFQTKGTMGSILEVKLVVELPSKPVVNDVVEEIFILPNGF